MRFYRSIKRLIILCLPVLFAALSLPLQAVNAENVNSLYSLKSTYDENAIRPPVDQRSLKITVDEDGIYELTKDTLRAAGFAVDTLDPNLIRMMYRGDPVAYQFAGDNGDNVFDDGETIRFYGWAFDGSRYEQFFVDKNIYWLWFGDSVNEERVESEANPPSANRTDVEQFSESLYIEKNRIFRTTPITMDNFDGFEADSWFWAKYGQRYHGRYVSAFQIFVGTDQEVELKGTAGRNATIVVKRVSINRCDVNRGINQNIVVETTDANGSGEWSIDIENLFQTRPDFDADCQPERDADGNQIMVEGALQTTYDITVEAEDGSEVKLLVDAVRLDNNGSPDLDTDGNQVITEQEWQSTTSDEHQTIFPDDSPFKTSLITHFFDKKRYFLDIPDPAPTDNTSNFTVEFMTNSDGLYTTTAELAGGSSTVTLRNKDYKGGVGEFVNRELVDGNNLLVISGENVTDSFLNTQEMYGSFLWDNFNQNRVWFNGITVDYTRLLMADDNQLRFRYETAGDYNFLVSGFEESDPNNMIVWDISDRLNPTHLTLEVSDGIADFLSYQWRIGKSVVDEPAEIFATVRANVRSVTTDQLETYMAVDLDPADAAGAEWVAISHANFMRSTSSLAVYRGETSELTTHVVDVEDVINQYGFGYNIPEAIRNYMIHAYRDRDAWGTAPRYLLLVGDSDWNPLDRYCSQCTVWDVTEPTYVIADYQFIDPFTGMNTTDHRYAMLDGDDVEPDIAVGRIPAQTSEEVDIVLEKMQQYERAIYNQDSWVSNMLFLADDEDTGGDFCNGVTEMRQLIDTNAPGVYDFLDIQCLDNYLPDNFNADELAAAKETVRNYMYQSVNGDNGVGIINYRGHGAVDNWGGGIQNLRRVRPTDHLESWENARRPTVIISADCFDTEFGRSALPSLAETLLKHENGGSVAHFGSTGQGLDGDHTILTNGFYGGITQDEPIHTIGDAAVNAKNYYIDQKQQNAPAAFGDLTDIAKWHEVLSFTVLGDPALTIPTSNRNPFSDEPSDDVTRPPLLGGEFTHRLFLPSIQGGY